LPVTIQNSTTVHKAGLVSLELRISHGCHVGVVDGSKLGNPKLRNVTMF